MNNNFIEKTNTDKAIEVNESQYNTLKNSVDSNKAVMECRFVDLEKTIKDTKKEIEQFRKHVNVVFLSIMSLLLIILSNELYVIFSK